MHRTSRIESLTMRMRATVIAGALIAAVASTAPAADAPAPAAATTPADALAAQIIKDTAVRGGLIIHLNCGDGTLTTALRAGDAYVVQGLDTDPIRVATARRHVMAKGLYGPVSVDRWNGKTLPYVDNFVNLIVSEQPVGVAADQIMRVLAPQGVAYIKSGGAWTRTVKPRPAQIDEWTHYLHDPSNNAVAHDQVVGPPRRLQWVAGPRYSRHHDKMSSLSALVSTGGRLFYIFDEAPRVSILLPPQWNLIARDAFNGTVLWKRPIQQWHSHLWPLKNGPAQLPRRLVAVGDRVYVTLSIDGPVQALDAATGQTVRTYEGTAGAEEIVVKDGLLFAVVKQGDEAAADRARRRGQAWTPVGWRLVVLQADTGKALWQHDQAVLPNTLAVGDEQAVFHDGQSVVCLDRQTGNELWRSEPVARAAKIQPFFAPTLVIYKRVVLFAGGERAGVQRGWDTVADHMSALNLKTGKVLWTAPHPASGYRSAEDLLVINGLVWTGETTSGRAKGVFQARDAETGDVVHQFAPDVDTYWFHHRCYRGKATDNYLLMSRAGIEYIDVKKESWNTNHFVRGSCLYGIMPANGLTYAPQHPCACYLEAKLSGFNALAPAAARPIAPIAAADRLIKGPAYADRHDREPGAQDWPTFRHDDQRSGHASTTVPTSLQPAWQTQLTGKLTSPVIADNKLFVASADTHTVYALDATTGGRLWDFTAGARVDSPPTFYHGRVFFGSADGWVYALRASDGQVAWRFLAATADRRTMAFGQLESVWPVHGSVLIKNGTLYCVAGRSMFLDGGIRLWRLDPDSGSVVSVTAMNNHDEQSGKDIQDYVSWLNMPTALPDVLSCDGRFVYMRSQPFDLSGKRLPLKAMPHRADADAGAPDPVQEVEHAHIFSPTGFLDGSFWSRTYWMYGTMFVSGWQGYYRAGTTAPAGRILVSDDKTIFGYGRKPQYWRWTTAMEDQLFSSPKPLPNQPNPRRTAPPQATNNPAAGQATIVSIEKSPALNTAKSPVTVEAWVRADKPDGVIVARGGSALGYSLYLNNGRPTFAVRTSDGVATAAAKAKAIGRWVHLAGVLNEQGALQLYVDGKPAASAKSPGLIAADPLEGLEIGTDANSAVAPYKGTVEFTGLIDDVRVYRQALGADQVAADARAADAAAPLQEKLVLAYSFDDAKATDASANKLDGQVQGAKAEPGKFGSALRFVGRAAPAAQAKAVPGFAVPYDWATDMPIYVRGLVLADGVLFLAGPRDVVDEEQAIRQLNDTQMQATLAEQVEIWNGKKGAILWAVNAATGQKQSELRLDAPPVFDGMAAANGRLYLATTDGKVLCLTGH